MITIYTGTMDRCDWIYSGGLRCINWESCIWIPSIVWKCRMHCCLKTYMKFERWIYPNLLHCKYEVKHGEFNSQISPCVVWNEWCNELTLYGSVAARWAFWAATKSWAVWCCETPVGKCGGKYGWWCWKSAARWFPGKPDAEMPWLRRSWKC